MTAEMTGSQSLTTSSASLGSPGSIHDSSIWAVSRLFLRKVSAALSISRIREEHLLGHEPVNPLAALRGAVDKMYVRSNPHGSSIFALRGEVSADGVRTDEVCRIAGAENSISRTARPCQGGYCENRERSLAHGLGASTTPRTSSRALDLTPEEDLNSGDNLVQADEKKTDRLHR